MDYFGNDTPWYGGWCRGRQSINCPVRKSEGFCRCVIAELPQYCQKEVCRKKIHEGDCIVKTGDGWGHVDCCCDDLTVNHHKRRRRRGQPEEGMQQPELDQNNSLDAILDAISKYRSPSQSNTRTPRSRMSNNHTPQAGQKEVKRDDQVRIRQLVTTGKGAENIMDQQSGSSSQVTSVAPSIPVVTPHSGDRTNVDEDTVQPRRAKRKLRF